MAAPTYPWSPKIKIFRHTDAWLMILGTAQGCNQWNPYERRRAAKAETLACHSSTRGVFFMLAWGGHHDPRCPSRLAFTVAPQHFSLKVGAVELADQESAGRSPAQRTRLTHFGHALTRAVG